MAAPTKAQLITELQAIVDWTTENRNYASVNAKNVVDLQDAMETVLKGDFNDQITAGSQAIRGAINSAVISGRLLLDPHFRKWARLIDADPAFNSNVAADVQFILSDVFDFLLAEGDSVNSRDITFGAPTSFGAGKGTIQRLTKDENALDIENGHSELKIVTCLFDQNTGTEKGKEQFRFEGQTRGRDELENLGSGIVDESFFARHPDESLLLNPGWDDTPDSLLLPTAIANWTSDIAVIGDGTDFIFHQGTAEPSAIYLPKTNDAVERHSLEIKLSRTISQKTQLRRTALSPNAPYYIQVAWNRDEAGVAGTGTLKLRLGSQEVTVVIAAQVGWQVLRMPLDENLWFSNFNENDLSIEVEFLRTTGAVVVDDIILVQMQAHDGTHHVITPARTPFLVDDVSTFTDSETGAKIQEALKFYYRRFLPHNNAGAETITDP